KTGYDFSGVQKPQNANDTYAVRYAEFVVPLVKAVQELANENEKLMVRNQELEAMLNSVIDRIKHIETTQMEMLQTTSSIR
ncbi:MAG: hypothetical protein KA521_11415, partial [Crocinitomicaceae bacterium]|nr:hypothetical protein [Crocinitomicaceae bacterium]